MFSTIGIWHKFPNLKFVSNTCGRQQTDSFSKVYMLTYLHICTQVYHCCLLRNFLKTMHFTFYMDSQFLPLMLIECQAIKFYILIAFVNLCFVLCSLNLFVDKFHSYYLNYKYFIGRKDVVIVTFLNLHMKSFSVCLVVGCGRNYKDKNKSSKHRRSLANELNV